MAKTLTYKGYTIDLPATGYSLTLQSARLDYLQHAIDAIEADINARKAIQDKGSTDYRYSY